MPQTAHYPFIWMGSLCAALYAAVTLLRKKDRFGSVLFFLFGAGTAGVLLLFGYVEYYAVAFIAILLFLISAERYLRGEGRVAPVIIWFVLAVGGHYYSLALAPALMIVLLRGREASLPYIVRKLTQSVHGILNLSAAVFAVFLAVYFILGWQQSDSRIVSPMFPVSNESGTLSYTLLSITRLFDLINLVLLFAPVPIAALIAFHGHGNRAEKDAAINRLHVTAILFFSIFLLFANASLGYARDWDLAAPLGGMISLYVLYRLRSVRHAALRGLPLLTALASVLYVVPWITVNVSPASSAERFEALMSLDSDKMYRDYALSGYEALRKHHEFTGNKAKEIEIIQTKIDLLHYPGDYRLLILSSLSYARTDRKEYLRLNNWMIDKLTEKAEALRAVNATADYGIKMVQIDSLAEIIAGNAYVYRNLGELRRTLDKLFLATGSSAPYVIANALAAYNAKNFPDAITGFEEAIESGFSTPAIYLYYATSLGIEKRHTEAIRIIEEGIRLYPNDVQLNTTLANWLIQAGITPDRAKALLDRALASNPDEAARQKIVQLYRRLGYEVQ